MKEPIIQSVLCLSPAGFHRMVYYEWGEPDNPRLLLCVHGLTRTGRDFDRLAQALADGYRVVCPDVVGRGRSDWLRDARHYALTQYAQDMTALIARLGVEKVDWLGTSMGGMIGMYLAAQEGTPIRRLILNDIGGVIPAAALQRIGEYVGKEISFATREEAEAYLRGICASFGRLDAEQWRHLTHHSLRHDADGRLRFCYDPAIAAPYRSMAQGEGGFQDIVLWPLYDSVRCPTLVIRGAQSDLLLPEIAREMQSRGPHAEVVEVPDVGHAPMFMTEAQIAIVREWLSRPC
ncbi:MAG: alpha/beta hydrolase [Rhodocyclaceae bacterium]|nr:alpha/beta hydrolase [Rhodocyclaceae bacterium]